MYEKGGLCEDGIIAAKLSNRLVPGRDVLSPVNSSVASTAGAAVVSLMKDMVQGVEGE
jgi:hypothetical protein